MGPVDDLAQFSFFVPVVDQSATPQSTGTYLHTCGWLLIKGLVDNNLLRRSQAYWRRSADIAFFFLPRISPTVHGVVSGGAKQSCLGGEAILMGGASRTIFRIGQSERALTKPSSLSAHTCEHNTGNTTMTSHHHVSRFM
jgi:hypothetical protein